LFKAKSPGMIRSWRKAAAQNRGRGRGGRGGAPSLAQRWRSLQLAETHTLIAIANGNFSSFIFPHPHAALGRSPVPALPFQLQQPIVIAHHPVLAHHAFFLQPEHFVQLQRCRPSPVIIGGGRSLVRVTSIVLGEVVLLQKRIGLVIVPDPCQSQFLHQPILMRAVRPLHASFRLRRTGRDDPDSPASRTSAQTA